MSSTYESLMVSMKKKSQEECETHLKNVMSPLKEKLTFGHYRKPGGFQELMKDLEKATKEYEKKTKGEVEGCAVLTHFLEEEKRHFDHVQEMDSKLAEEQMRIPAFKGELSRVIHEKVNMAQTWKGAEECRNKEIMDQIRKRVEKRKMCSVEELKEAMEHTKSEMKKYKKEGRMEDAERARQRYKYLKKKYQEATEWSFMKFKRRVLRLFQRW